MAAPFDPQASTIRVTAVLQGLVRRRARLVLDTGASRTVLAPRLVEVIQARPAGHVSPVPIMTAGGMASAEQVRLTSVSLQGFTVGPVDVLCTPLPTQLGAAGLLGLDILRHFNVTLDFEHGELTLERFPTDRVKETIATYSAPPARAA